ncbi:hypothetical protein AABB24_028086, partial [Solanum stoloniferum]
LQISTNKFSQELNPLLFKLPLYQSCSIFLHSSSQEPAIFPAKASKLGPYGGVLLSEVALDANNGLFSIAFAIVEREQNETWRWFSYWLNDFIGAWPRNKPWTFTRDRQKGLHQAYVEIIPFVKERYCARHIYANSKAQYPGLLLRNYFWQAAKSYEVKYFNEAMEMIKQVLIENRKANLGKTCF